MDKKTCEKVVEKNLYSRNFNRYGLDINPVVSLSSGIFIIIFSLYALINLDQANRLFVLLNDTIVTNFDWVFILSSNLFVIICLYLAFSKLGEVRIGGVSSETEFSTFAWYSMLLSAGMGIGLMFWAVGEPLHHFVESPPIFSSSNTDHSAMATTFFHWGLHPWGIYALMALSLSFFSYNKKLPLSLRSAFYPIFKERIYGILGDIIDIFAVLSTLFGLATSLGLGIQQINSGLDYMLNIGVNVSIQVALITIITGIAVVSVISGIDRGVKFLSMLNIRLAAAFMVAIILLGPTAYIVSLFSNSLGLYVSGLVQSASYIATGDKAWQGGWSVFYLAWWISWSPFVGMFIARISRGRTVREFILGVLLVPSLISFIWLAAFGGTSIYINNETGGSLFAVVQDNLPVALFEMITLLEIPFIAGVAQILMFVLATVLIISYFITSSDSGSLVVDKLTTGGKINSPTRQKVFWACLEGLLAATLLLIGGERALFTLQTAVISAGLPLAIILIIMSYSLIKGLEITHLKQKDIRDVIDTRRLKQFVENEESMEDFDN